MNKIYYLIPARKNSKGLPKKNRILFDITASSVNKEEHVIVSSDDEFILEKAKRRNFIVHVRSDKNASDTATTKDFALEVCKDLKLKNEDIVVILMLTYPDRNITDIKNAIDFFKKTNSKSMLCKKSVKSTPYLMLYEKDNHMGEQVIKHNLCRRQDYRKVFELSHFVCAFKVSELEKLNNNLYNGETHYYTLDKRIIDIDTIEDLNNWKKNE